MLIRTAYEHIHSNFITFGNLNPKLTFMKRILQKISLVTFLALIYVQACCAAWSFSGGYISFDNSTTQWSGVNIYLIIGKSSYSSVYKMSIDPNNANRYITSLPASGWSDAEYMAVIGNSNWEKGNFGYDQLKNATYYTAAYTAGLTSGSSQSYLFTPASASNGTTIALTLDGTVPSVTFTTEEKNRCYKLDDTKQLITLIYSTSAKRFNTNKSTISKVYAYGSFTKWKNSSADYQLNMYSDDGCFYVTLPYSMVEAPGNCGQPEYMFYVIPTSGDAYTVRSHSSWEEGIDSRLVFGNKMLIAWNGDDLDDIGSRYYYEKTVRPLSDFDLSKDEDQHKITNFRKVPATENLYRSYHPYKPDREGYDTERTRMVYIDKLATAAGIKSDIALSGNMESYAGKTYTCNGTTYTITIPDYYKSIIAGNNVLYVGTQNGHTPDFNTVIFESNSEKFAQWFKEIIEFIADDSHPAPFQIHCSLGADRTGMFCANLAAICGATWEQIYSDYESTSNLMINEYRHRNVVRYSIRQIIGEDPATCSNLAQAVANHYIDGGYLTQAQIDKAVAKLKGTSTGIFLSEADEKDSIGIIAYDLLGRKVTGTPAPGLYITSTGRKVIVK